MTSLLSRLSCSQISFMGRFFSYSLRMIWRRAAIVALLFFPNLWDRKRTLFSFLILRAASSLYGKFGRFSWQDTVLRMVSHSLSVSESFSFQFEYHCGFHRMKLCSFAIGVFPKTSPQPPQTLSPFWPWGARTVPLQFGHSILALSPLCSPSRNPKHDCEMKRFRDFGVSLFCCC